MFLRSLGTAVGVVVGGTVFQNVMTYKSIELELSESIVQDNDQPTPAAPTEIGVSHIIPSVGHRRVS